MKYYTYPNTGEVYAYESEQERQEWGAPELVEMTPAEVDAHLNPPAQSEQLAADARAARDRLLSESDWIVTRSIETAADTPPEWLAYRQALRDVPQQPGFPENIDWPELPDGI